MRTAHARRAECVHLLGISAGRALVQRSHIFQGLSCQEPVSLLHVGCLLLRHSLEDTLPDVA